MEYVVVRSGGKQYKVKKGDVIQIEKINGSINDPFEFHEVLLHVLDSEVRVGNPLLSDMVVGSTIIEQAKGPKIRVSKYKAKVRYRRVVGHRQKLTKVKIESFGAKKEQVNSKPLRKKAEPAKRKK